jgi:hypothetical protein
LQLVLQLKEMGLQLGVEAEYGVPVALTLLGPQGSGVEGGKAGEFWVQLDERA